MEPQRTVEKVFTAFTAGHQELVDAGLYALARHLERGGRVPDVTPEMMPRTSPDGCHRAPYVRGPGCAIGLSCFDPRVVEFFDYRAGRAYVLTGK